MAQSSPEAAALVQRLIASIRSNALDEAEALYTQLCEVRPAAAQDMLVFPTVIAIQRGRTLDALRYLNSLPEDRCPELKAICLRLLGDPTWHSYAETQVDAPDPYVRKAMRQLLGRDVATG